MTASLKTSENLARAKEAVRLGRSPRANSDMAVPPRYRGKTLGSFAFDLETVARRAAFATEALLRGESVFLTGSPGSGKTHLAVGLMREWCAENLAEADEGKIYHGKGAPLFVSSVDLLGSIKRTWDEGGSEHAVMERYFKTPLLVIDDLGAERASDWSRQVFYLIIDRRYRDATQVIVTSNLDMTRLMKTLDDRVASRLCEMGVTIDLGTTDYRVDGRRARRP
jgi:DNA replication protein DnaC